MLFVFCCTVELFFVYLVGFLEREIWKRDIHKSDNPPTFPFYHYIQEESSRAKNGEGKAVWQAPAKS